MLQRKNDGGGKPELTLSYFLSYFHKGGTCEALREGVL